MFTAGDRDIMEVAAFSREASLLIRLSVSSLLYIQLCIY